MQKILRGALAAPSLRRTADSLTGLVAMMDVIKKTLLAGVGAAVITKEKVEAALDEFVKQGKVSSTEARAMADKIASEGRREFETLSKQLNDLFREGMAREDKKAQDRLTALEARVAALEQRSNPDAEAPEAESSPVLDATGKAAGGAGV